MTGFFRSSKFVALLWAAIFVVWGLSMFNEWLFYHWWVDIVLHFAGGFWVFTIARYTAEHYRIEIYSSQKELARFVVFVSFVAFVGVLWEFYEFILDRYITMSGFTYLARVFEDTLLDLLMDMIGGITAFLFYKNAKS